GRTFSDVGNYRYGFNGKENDGDFQQSNQGQLIQDYGFRIYNPSIGKFLSVDPLAKDYPSWSPYPFAMNRPIDGLDLDGAEWWDADDQVWRYGQNDQYLRVSDNEWIYTRTVNGIQKAYHHDGAGWSQVELLESFKSAKSFENKLPPIAEAKFGRKQKYDIYAYAQVQARGAAIAYGVKMPYFLERFSGGIGPSGSIGVGVVAFTTSNFDKPTYGLYWTGGLGFAAIAQGNVAYQAGIEIGVGQGNRKTFAGLGGSLGYFSDHKFLGGGEFSFTHGQLSPEGYFYGQMSTNFNPSKSIVDGSSAYFEATWTDYFHEANSIEGLIDYIRGKLSNSGTFSEEQLGQLEQSINNLGKTLENVSKYKESSAVIK
ncbi:MAG: RHS repeat-associated core domain-containing protein, partial [Saprospiraceae bacterium]